MAKTKFQNMARGARGVWSGGNLHMVEPGASIDLDVDAAELKDQKANRYFAINGKKPSVDDDDQADVDVADDDDKGPLDQSVAKLKDHLAGVEDLDELEQLGADEAAGANRSGALDAIQARIDELKGEDDNG